MLNEHISEAPKTGDFFLNNKVDRDYSILNKKTSEKIYNGIHNNDRQQSTGEIIEKFSKGNSALIKPDSSADVKIQNYNSFERDYQVQPKISGKMNNAEIINSANSQQFKNIHTENFNGNLAVKQNMGNVRFMVKSNGIGKNSNVNQLENMNLAIPGIPVETKTAKSINLKDLKQSITSGINPQLPKIENDEEKLFSQKESNENKNKEFNLDNGNEKELHIPQKELNQTQTSPVFDITYIETGNDPVNMSPEKFSTFRSSVIHLFDMNHTRFIEGKIKGTEKGKFIIHTREYGKIQLNFRNEDSILFIEIFYEDHRSEKNIKSQLKEIKQGILSLSSTLTDVQFSLNRFNPVEKEVKNEISSTVKNKVTRFRINENHQLNHLV